MKKFAAVAAVLLSLQGSLAFADDMDRPRVDERMDRRALAASDGDVNVDERMGRRQTRQDHVVEGIQNDGEGIQADERMENRSTRRGYAAESIDGNGVRVDDRQDRRSAIANDD